MESAKIDVKVTFKGFDSSDALKEYAEKKAHKLSKHLHQMTYCAYVFSIEKTDHLAQLHVVSGDFEAKAEARGLQMYAAIDEVTDKLVNQTRKYKEKQSTHHVGGGHHNQSNEVPDES